MYKISVLGLLLAITLNNFAADTTKVSDNNNFFRISIDIKSYKFLDQQTSALSYEGIIPGLQLAYESNKAQQQYGINLIANYGSVIGKTKYANYIANQGYFSLDGFYIHKFSKDSKKFRIFAGLSIQHQACLHYNQNLQNASFTLSIINHLDLNANFERDFSWKSKSINLWFIKFKRRDRKVKTSLNIKVPIFFQNYRSPYATISDFSDGENLWSLKKSNYFIFSKAIMLETNASLSYYLHNGNALRLSYHWQAFRFSDQFFSYQAAYHGFSFSILMKLN